MLENPEIAKVTLHSFFYAQSNSSYNHSISKPSMPKNGRGATALNNSNSIRIRIRFEFLHSECMRCIDGLFLFLAQDQPIENGANCHDPLVAPRPSDVQKKDFTEWQAHLFAILRRNMGRVGAHFVQIFPT